KSLHAGSIPARASIPSFRDVRQRPVNSCFPPLFLVCCSASVRAVPHGSSNMCGTIDGPRAGQRLRRSINGGGLKSQFGTHCKRGETRKAARETLQTVGSRRALPAREAERQPILADELPLRR